MNDTRQTPQRTIFSCVQSVNSTYRDHAKQLFGAMREQILHISQVQGFYTCLLYQFCFTSRDKLEYQVESSLGFRTYFAIQRRGLQATKLISQRLVLSMKKN